jgi:hypothetical protein
MATLNAVFCGAGSGNMGIGDCNFDPDLLVGAIAIPRGTVYAASQLVDFRATLQAQAINNSYSLRAHIFGGFLELDDQSEEAQEWTSGYGRKYFTRDEVYSWGFRYLDGGMCQHKNMLNFKGRERQFDWLFFDASYNIIGTDRTDANGITGFGGVNLTQFYPYNWKPKTGSEPTRYMVGFTLANARQLNENLSFISVDFDPYSDIDQVQDVKLQPVSDPVVDADGDINIGITSSCGAGNLVQIYGATIANVARFVATNSQTGGAVTITSVTIAGSGESQYLAFNFDDTDTDYPTAGQYLTLTMASVSVLATAGLSYFEAMPIQLEVL